MEKYIDLNTELRTKATNDFEDFFKLINSVFGKTIETIEKRVDVRLVIDEAQLAKQAAIPAFFNRCVIFNVNLVDVHINRTKIRYIISLFI